MNVEISSAAEEDLQNIWLYTLDTWSLVQADRYFNLIMDEIEYIGEHPFSGKDYSYIRENYFRSAVKSHLIFYKINRKINQVEIIRILHKQMDIESRLLD